MVTAAAKAMNTSTHTLSALKEFAKASPEEATAYLERVEANLRKLGQPAQAEAIAEVLARTGSLVERIGQNAARLGAIFPANAADWGKVQLSRAATVGYDERPKPDLATPFYLQGRISKGEDGAAVFETTGGQVLKLNLSTTRVSNGELSPTLVAGFIDDGPISLQGTPSEDQKSFNVEGFALNADGKFAEFTFGRVTHEGAVVSTPRGDVAIEDPQLKARLKALPRLGVILPGAPELRDGRLVYTGRPDEMFGLAKFHSETPTGDGETRVAPGDMAYSMFSSKPIELPADQAERARHSGRVWLRGQLELDANGVGTRFKASYVSQPVDAGAPDFGTSTTSADPVQAAVWDEVV